MQFVDVIMRNRQAHNAGLAELIEKVTQWHYDRNLILGSDNKNQVMKTVEEVAELVKSVSRKKSPIDDIGDIIVTLINIAEREDISIEECLEHAYLEIKDRKGRMIDGVFVKESDLEKTS